MARFALCFLLAALVSVSSGSLAADDANAPADSPACHGKCGKAQNADARAAAGCPACREKCDRAADAEASVRPMVLAFEAAWCGPCQKMAPLLTKLQQEGYAVRRVNVDDEQELAKQYGITSIPAFVAVLRGAATRRINGIASEARLRGLLSADANRAACEACVHEFHSVAEVPAAIQTVSLIRATYPLEQEKAEAFLAFLSEHADVQLETRLHDDALEITTTPEQQMVIGRFIAMFLCNDEHLSACTGSSHHACSASAEADVEGVSCKGD